MVHALTSDASLVVDQSGAKFDTSRVTGHVLRLPVSGIQFHGRWNGMSVLAHVKEPMVESEGLLGLEPTWEGLKDQLRSGHGNAS